MRLSSGEESPTSKIEPAKTKLEELEQEYQAENYYK